MTTYIRRVLLAITAATLLAAACGSDDDSTGADSLPDQTSSTVGANDHQADEPAVDDQTVEPAALTGLDAALATIVEETGVPAIGVAMYDHNGLLDMAVSGVRRRGEPTEVTLDDTFHIGSNTKAMTAALLARLDEQDRGISFGTTLGVAFPAMANLHEGYADVTMAQLLTHTGGAPYEDLDIDETILSMPVTGGRAIGTELVLSDAPAVEPGSAVAYSNAGYVIVGAAMEQATGDSWEQLMIDEVFAPLGMSSCAFGPPGTEGLADQPMGHGGDGDPVYWDNPPLLGPAGGVHCSMADWGTFLVELLNGHRGASGYLTPASIDSIFAPAAVPIDEESGMGSAAGWLVIDGPDGPDGPGFYHNGSNTAWFSQALILPNTDRVLLAVTNEEGTGEVAAGQAFAVLSDRDTTS